MKSLCPKCGQPSEEGLCNSCVIKSEKMLSCPDMVEVTICSICGSRMVKGRWQISEKSIEEMATEAVCSSLCIHKDIESPEIEIDLSKRGATRYLARMGLKGTFRGTAIEEGCEIPVRIKLVACDRCSRIAGKYFESTVQIRASSDRPLTQWELEECKKMAESMAEAGYRGGDQLSFIQEIKDVRGGVDIILGSTQLGRQMARAIYERFGGKLVESSKLVGRKDSRDVYRTTILVRFPRLKRGDIVSFRGTLFEVTGFDGKKTLITALQDDRRSALGEDDAETIEILGNTADAQKAIVTAKD
ncbi:MAG: 60S ribosomal export protein NMD3, partial [Methanotrichaceae archaeon]|nr:60S ribosomal export protein NMD3 [Methanotrichaceae archaeon]